MGMPVFVIGFSGSGKSSSLRNFQPDEVGVFSVARKTVAVPEPNQSGHEQQLFHHRKQPETECAAGLCDR